MMHSILVFIVGLLDVARRSHCEVIDDITSKDLPIK